MSAPKPPFNLDAIRQDFPALAQEVRGKPLTYLDNAASSQTPSSVVDALVRGYTTCRANIHRGVHLLSQQATEQFEAVREKTRAFIGAEAREEIIFVRGTTEGINLVANTFGQQRVGAGDEVLITGLEHHSNLVPWQMLCERVGATLKWVPLQDDGSVQAADFAELLSPRTKLAAVAHVSNALGTILPLKEMIDAAHAQGVPVVVDGAQAAPHLAIDMQALDADFYVFSSHKMYGPTGVGVLYGKREHLDAMPPWQGGGDMIGEVTLQKSTWAELPNKFEAGTPDITGVIAFGAALDYVQKVGLEHIASWEHALLQDATAKLSAIPGVRLVGTAKEKAAVLSFVVDNVHPHDIGTIMDMEGVAIRTGHHCAQPVMERFGVAATARASFAIYNTPAEVDALVAGLHKCIDLLG